MWIPINLHGIQGNGLGGISKDFQSNLFLKFTGDKPGRVWLKEIIEEISSSADVIQFNDEFRALKKQGVKKPEAIISAVWVNLAISFAACRP